VSQTKVQDEEKTCKSLSFAVVTNRNSTVPLTCDVAYWPK